VDDSSVCSLTIPTFSRLGNLFKTDHLNGKHECKKVYPYISDHPCALTLFRGVLAH